MTITAINALLARRYLERIESAPDDPFAQDERLSLQNLIWMCETLQDESIDPHKSTRWLGFVQGCLAMRGLISVDEERDFSRPLFHSVSDTPLKTLERASN